MNAPTVPPPPPRRPARGPRSLHPLLVGLLAAAAAVLFVGGVGFAILLVRGGHRSGAQEVVGSGIPAGWVPGRGGAGVPPPLPPAAPGGPVGAPPPLPSAPAAPPPDQQQQQPEASGEVPGQPPPGPPPVAPPPQPAVAQSTFTPPRLLSLPTPDYPPAGQRMGVEGTVVLQVLVAADGHVLEANPVGERLGMGFEAAARRAAFGARFEPARRDGAPVDGETRLAIRFKLQ